MKHKKNVSPHGSRGFAPDNRRRESPGMIFDPHTRPRSQSQYRASNRTPANGTDLAFAICLALLALILLVVAVNNGDWPSLTKWLRTPPLNSQSDAETRDESTSDDERQAGEDGDQPDTVVAAKPVVGAPDRVASIELEAGRRGPFASGSLRSNAVLFRNLKLQVNQLEQRDQLQHSELQRSRRLNDALIRGRINLVLDKLQNVGMELVVVPPGECLIGRTEEERQTANAATNGQMHDATSPAFRVRIPYSFFIGEHEVTRQQYAVFLREKRSQRLANPSKLPMTEVNWLDAMDFCLWLSDQTGYQIRLPHEVEWEYAARGLGGTTFAFADNRRLETNQLVESLMPVDENNSVPSWCGAFHMVDNVQEWCINTFDDGQYERVAHNSPLHFNVKYNSDDYLRMVKRGSVGRRQVVRGGGFTDSSVVNCEAATRRWKIESAKKDYLGFRVVVILPMN